MFAHGIAVVGKIAEQCRGTAVLGEHIKGGARTADQAIRVLHQSFIGSLAGQHDFRTGVGFLQITLLGVQPGFIPLPGGGQLGGFQVLQKQLRRCNIREVRAIGAHHNELRFAVGLGKVLFQSIQHHIVITHNGRSAAADHINAPFIAHRLGMHAEILFQRFLWAHPSAVGKIRGHTAGKAVALVGADKVHPAHQHGFVPGSCHRMQESGRCLRQGIVIGKNAGMVRSQPAEHGHARRNAERAGGICSVKRGALFPQRCQVGCIHRHLPARLILRRVLVTDKK